MNSAFTLDSGKGAVQKVDGTQQSYDHFGSEEAGRREYAGLGKANRQPMKCT